MWKYKEKGRKGTHFAPGIGFSFTLSYNINKPVYNGQLSLQL